jgi:hypothetical protein
LICLDSLCKVTRGKKPEAKWQSDHLAALTDELEEEKERERERETEREREGGVVLHRDTRSPNCKKWGPLALFLFDSFLDPDQFLLPLPPPLPPPSGAWAACTKRKVFTIAAAWENIYIASPFVHMSSFIHCCFK